jgi:hypothetical protein
MTCHGNGSRNGSKSGIFLRNSLSVSSTSSMPCDKSVTQCPSVRPVLECLSMLHIFSQKLKVNEFELGLIVRIHPLLWVPGILDQGKCVGLWGSTLPAFLPRGKGQAFLDQSDPLSSEFLGKAHRIHAAVNNR